MMIVIFRNKVIVASAFSNSCLWFVLEPSIVFRSDWVLLAFHLSIKVFVYIIYINICTVHMCISVLLPCVFLRSRLLFRFLTLWFGFSEYVRWLLCVQHEIFQRVIDDCIAERFDCGHNSVFLFEAFSPIANSKCGYEIECMFVCLCVCVYMFANLFCHAIDSVAQTCRWQQRWTTASGKMKFCRKKKNNISLFFPSPPPPVSLQYSSFLGLPMLRKAYKHTHTHRIYEKR